MTTTLTSQHTFRKISMKLSWARGMFMVALLQNGDRGSPAFSSLSPYRGHTARSLDNLGLAHSRICPCETWRTWSQNSEMTRSAQPLAR